MKGGIVQVGAWVRLKTSMAPLVRVVEATDRHGLVVVAMLPGHLTHILNNTSLGLRTVAWPEESVEPTTPTPEELAQWREALRKVGLALVEDDLAELVDNLLSYHADDTHCWYCSWPKGEHRADCVWARAISAVSGAQFLADELRIDELTAKLERAEAANAEMRELLREFVSEAKNQLLRLEFEGVPSNSPSVELWQGMVAKGSKALGGNHEGTIERLRELLATVMEWATHFATPMPDELRESVRKALEGSHE